MIIRLIVLVLEKKLVTKQTREYHDDYTCYEKILDIPVIPERFEIHSPKVSTNDEVGFLSFELQVDHGTLAYDLIDESYSIHADITTYDDKIHKALSIAGFTVRDEGL